MTLFPTPRSPLHGPRSTIESRRVTDQRNMILAIVLSVLVIIGWTFASDRFLPHTPPRVAATQAGRRYATQPGGPALPPSRPTRKAIAPDGAVVPAVGGAGQLRDRGAVLAETPRWRSSRRGSAGSINLKGARIDDLVLKGYKETIKPGSPDVRLLAPSGRPGGLFRRLRLERDRRPPGRRAVDRERAAADAATPVTLTYTTPQGTKFEIVLAVDSRLSVHRHPARDEPARRAR